MAIVHFYTHEALEKAEPTRGLGQRFRRWLVRLVSPRFGHCAIEVDHGGFVGLTHMDYSGYRWEDIRKYPASATDTLISLGAGNAGCRSHGRPRWCGLKMVLAYFLPRKFDNCASYVGRLVYCPGARTPDELYVLLTEFKGAKPTGGGGG